ncbi:transcriptional regulator, marr family [Heliomicrobium modesticaldum Ice1]|uniref:Transcriptional regulator, marr family n=1 Tax=Heliobacterium modesticaldum (strain ATCC 51547 / Ice1) TaxID=498761 RepID=B0TEA4_HELMI|nr:MarR family transcriptional regulator [Heliomicrobium modesticaldum]ABZ85586.1 transcriptional regulator, marr family [Heliomicrobium modesticaldum Ice1]
MRKNSAIYLIGRLRGKVHQFLEQQLRDQGIDDIIVSQGYILAALYKNQGQLTMKDLAQRVKRDKSTITYLVDKLIRNHYVIKVKCQEDQRVTWVKLTDKGIAFQPIFDEISRKLIEQFYLPFTEEEAVLLERLLEKGNAHWPD